VIPLSCKKPESDESGDLIAHVHQYITGFYVDGKDAIWK
jgi:hypothetical protein